MQSRSLRAPILLLAFALVTGCANREPVGPEHETIAPQPAREALDLDRPPSLPDIVSGNYAPATPEEAQAQVEESVRGWFFGPGLGRTMLNVGTAVLFPPYALYLVGNAGIALAGYEPLYITDALPATPRKHVLDTYNGVTGVPGHITALVAGTEYSDAR